MIHTLPIILLVASATAPLPPVPALKQADRLALSPSQVKTLKSIQAKYAVELATKRKALIDSAMAMHNEVQAVLTVEQKAKAKKLHIQ